jgi:hypothetical protein
VIPALKLTVVTKHNVLNFFSDIGGTLFKLCQI